MVEPLPLPPRHHRRLDRPVSLLPAAPLGPGPDPVRGIGHDRVKQFAAPERVLGEVERGRVDEPRQNTVLRRARFDVGALAAQLAAVDAFFESLEKYGERLQYCLADVAVAA